MSILICKCAGACVRVYNVAPLPYGSIGLSMTKYFYGLFWHLVPVFWYSYKISIQDTVETCIATKIEI